MSFITLHRTQLSLLVCLICPLVPVAPDSLLPEDKPHFSADAKTLYAAASEPATPEGTDVIVLHEEDSHVFSADGHRVHTEYLVYKVLTQEGVEDWDSISLSWAPWREERPILRARVITPDLVAHELDQKTIADAPAGENDPDIYSDARVLRAPLPAMGIGSVVEWEAVSRETAPLDGAGTVDRFFFGRLSAPVQHTRLILEAPPSVQLRYEQQLLSDLAPQRSEVEGRIRIMFERGRMDALERPDSYLPSDVPALPAVTFSTGSGWQQVAEEYAKTVDSRVNTAEIKPLVGKLVAGKKGRDDKSQAILDHIERNIRYTGVEFGNAAIVPHPPSETLSHKYGDCKDKATLLVAMLRAADIPAYIALLNTGSRQDVTPALPGMGMFDHAIVYVPGERDVWVDVTDEYARFGQLAISDQGRLALIVRPGSNALVRIPESPSSENVLLERREIHLTENGPARIVEISQPRGIFEPEYRRIYADKQNKENREALAGYVKSQYLAEKLDYLDRSDPRDLSKPFELELRSDKARRGFTDLDTAVAAIRIEGLFSRLPGELQSNSDEEKSTEDQGKPSKKRTADYQLPDPFVAEWQYEIFPPFGFQPKELPAKANLQLGPARLTEEFSARPNGTVRAVLRFDTSKRRFTVAEATEMRKKISELVKAPPFMINFEPSGQVMLRQGMVKESLQSYRSLIAQHPKEAVHHLQLAKALLDAGLGEAARNEAHRAIELEPNSALAEKTLSSILTYDLVGRKFRSGSDYAGAVAALRAAVKLDPEDKEAAGELAILLEHDDMGVRYGSGSRMKEAIAEYRKLGQEKLAGLGLSNNLAFALFYAGDFAEARENAESLNPSPKSLLVACEAAISGAKSGIAEANKRSSGDPEFKQIVKTAGEMLMNMRQYPLAADLLEAGASGSNAAGTMGLASMLRKARRHEELRFGNNPRDVVLSFLLVTLDPGITLEKLKGFLSKNALLVMKNTSSEENEEMLKAGKLLRGTMARSGVSPDVAIDILIQMVEPRGEGSDALGYRERLQIPGGKKMTAFIVKENDQYKVLDMSEKPDALGLEILDRVAARDSAGAGQLLDWLREEQLLQGGEDPLSGAVFPRFWTKGKAADAKQMRLSAAAILVGNKPTAKTGLAILAEARKAAAGDPEAANLDLALMSGHGQLEDHEKTREVSAALSKRYPESKSAFHAELQALLSLSRFDDADRLVQERLKRLPDDIDYRRAQIMAAYLRGDYRTGHALSQKLVDEGKAEAADLNGLAWDTLFFDHEGGPDIEAAIKASQLGQNNSHILHTLGSLYAEAGKTKEGREVLIQAMDLDQLDEPTSDYWYAFGRIAEQFGEIEVARADYAKVTRPKQAVQIPLSSYQLAQTRLAKLGGAVKGKAAGVK